MRPTPELFFYDTMILYRHVPDPNYTVPAWMGLPSGTDVSGETRPEIHSRAAWQAARAW
jgi:hypothetical protein